MAAPDHSAQPAEGVEALELADCCEFEGMLLANSGLRFRAESIRSAAAMLRTLAASRGDTPNARVRELFEALIPRWRETYAMHGEEWDRGYSYAREACADELAAALAAMDQETE